MNNDAIGKALPELGDLIAAIGEVARLDPHREADIADLISLCKRIVRARGGVAHIEYLRVLAR